MPVRKWTRPRSSSSGIWYDRSLEHEADRRHKSVDPQAFIAQYELELEPLPCWQHLPAEQYRQQIAEMVDGALDLHANNTYAVVLDDQDRCLLDKRLPNQLSLILRELEPYRSELAGVAVESTFNWYWLVDGLMDNGYCAKLVNTCAVKQYDGLKFTDDRHDARWLAHLQRLGILPTGYIYPKEQRPIRDLLRQRSTFVHRRTAHLLGLQNLLVRNTGNLIKGNALKRLTPEEVYEQLDDQHLVLGAQTHLAMIGAFNAQIHHLEKAVLAHARLKPSFRVLKSIGGVGQIWP